MVGSKLKHIKFVIDLLGLRRIYNSRKQSVIGQWSFYKIKTRGENKFWTKHEKDRKHALLGSGSGSLNRGMRPIVNVVIAVQQ